MIQPSPDFTQLITEMFAQSDRASAVVAASVLDELLERCLVRFIREDKKAKELMFDVYKPMSSFKAKTDLAYFLSLLSHDERSDLDTIRRIRNDFAHKFDTLTFSSPGIETLCTQLVGFRRTNPPAELKLSPLDTFRFCVTLLAGRLDHLSKVIPRITDYQALSESLLVK